MQREDINRALIESMVNKAIRDIRRDGRRTIRNLIDLGAHLGRGRFQQQIFSTLQTMLARKSSAYYPLVADIAASVRADIIKTFGINLGYNSWTRGAQIIREKEAALGYNIPWCLSFMPRDATQAEGFPALIEQGRALGIYTYIAVADRATLFPLCAAMAGMRDCAFVLFLQEDALAAPVPEALTALSNVLIALPAWARDAAAHLRDRGCLFGLYAEYDDASLDPILSGRLLESFLPSRCAFAFLVGRDGCTPAAHAAVREYIAGIRMSQRYPMLLMGLASDILHIDRVISREPCSLSIEGNELVITRAGGLRSRQALSSPSLQDALARVMPRVGYTALE